jgi:hypothetical protein
VRNFPFLWSPCHYRKNTWLLLICAAMLIYDGRPVQAWGNEMIRRCCERSNWDGIVPRADLENQLREKGIDIEYNEKRWIVIPRWLVLFPLKGRFPVRADRALMGEWTCTSAR